MDVKSVNLPDWLVVFLSSLVTGLAYVAIPFSCVYRACLKKHKAVELKSDDMASAVKTKAAKYKALAYYVQDSNGFVEWQHGDSTLFSALAACGGLNVQLLAARGPDGAWHRQPLSDPQEAAASSISRDMLLGVMWYAWRKRRLDIAEALWDYGVRHHWVMGTGDASRILLLPGLQGTLAKIIEALGGKSHWATLFPQLWNKGQTDYQAHLEVLHILLRGEIDGEVDSSQLAVLTEQSNREIMNPLFDVAVAKFTDGDVSRALRVLSTESYWPSQRLPLETDRSDLWLTQRDYGPDWQPGTGPGQWSGGDLLFVVGLL